MFSSRKTYAAFARGDIPTLLAGFHSEVQWRQAEGNPYQPDGAALVGPQAVLEKLLMRIGVEYTTMAKRGNSKPTVGDNHTFLTLLVAAREDPELSRTLLAVLSLPSFQRKSLLNSIIQEMTLRSEEADLIAAVAALRDDGVAAKAAEVLGKDR